MNARQHKQKPENENNENAETPVRNCGVVMPIGAMPPDYDSAHWGRVKEILYDAIREAKMHPRIVSDSDEIGVIHGQIVQNLYDDEIVVVDVSGKNPNVMFELGLRLAFDKPTIIVKDDITTYSFDTSPIKHIGYRRDQRFDDVEEFKSSVTNAIIATLKKKQEDEHFSPFLKHFGHFTPKKVENQEVPQADFILQKLASIERKMNNTIFVSEPALPDTLDRLGDGFASVSDWARLRSSPAELALVDRMREEIRRFRASGRFGRNENSLSARVALRKQLLENPAFSSVSEERFEVLFDAAWVVEQRQPK